jgi:hypothetical protein
MLAEATDAETVMIMPLEKLIVFGELGEREKAKREYERLLDKAETDSFFLSEIRRLGNKYELS